MTHGSPANMSGMYFNAVSYGVNENGVLDYEEIRRIALECKPKLIVAGASAYARTIDFKKFREISDEAGAYLMVDMAHIAGLVAGGQHPSPVPYADVVTTTTHKTLRGPRGEPAHMQERLISKNFVRFQMKQGLILWWIWHILQVLLQADSIQVLFLMRM